MALKCRIRLARSLNNASGACGGKFGSDWRRLPEGKMVVFARKNGRFLPGKKDKETEKTITKRNIHMMIQNFRPGKNWD